MLEVNNLKVYHATKHGQFIKAVDDISFSLREGETLGLVGESGCGKSTLGRAILQLIKPTSGEILYYQQDLVKLAPKALREKRKELQIIFQDPLASLNPRMTVGQIIAEPLKNFYSSLSKQEVFNRVTEIMVEVGLLPEHVNRYPHEFSGGQCQRIGIARALVLKPKLLICDEPVSALDVSIQAQIINLLKNLQKKYGLSLIFIAHNLSIVRHISDRIMVMYLGKSVELSHTYNIYTNPLHPYTKALLSAIPIPDPRLGRDKKAIILTGDLPSPVNPPLGCRFQTRCPISSSQCKQEPLLKLISDEHLVACHEVY
ncbi:MAG: ATP-binding cassette domain-containing protein [Gammaproteobacteria bacterium]|nr:ATP-binding cassette domain-containing protein [Gammaproteobacteria bacterium]